MPLLISGKAMTELLSHLVASANVKNKNLSASSNTSEGKGKGHLVL